MKHRVLLGLFTIFIACACRAGNKTNYLLDNGNRYCGQNSPLSLPKELSEFQLFWVDYKDLDHPRADSKGRVAIEGRVGVSGPKGEYVTAEFRSAALVIHPDGRDEISFETSKIGDTTYRFSGHYLNPPGADGAMIVGTIEKFLHGKKMAAALVRFIHIVYSE